MLAHATALVGFLVPVAGHIVGPLIIWLLKRSESAVVDQHGKESLNFQISMSIWGLLAAATCIIFIGFVLAPAVVATAIILTVIGTVKASNGELYHYPLTIRFIK